MFLSWMGRWDDPGLLRGDLMADYWQSVSPWFFRTLFHLAWQIGIEPTTFVKLLPALLYPIMALFSFRFLRAIGARPAIAFLTTALLLFFFTRDGSVVSGTPRALWPALLLAVLDGLARVRAPQAAVAQLFLAGCYPQLALVTATTIGLTLLAPARPFRLDLSRRRLILVSACAVATVAGILPFLLDSGRFGPVITLDQARLVPSFAAGGRNRIFEPDGSLDFLCDSRLGLFGSKCKQISDPQFPLLIVAALLGPVVLFLRFLRGGPAAMRSTLPGLLLITSLGWFAVAALLLFRLHLPSRYSAALTLLAIVTSFPVLLEWTGPVWSRLAGRRHGRAVLNGGLMAMVVLAVLALANARHVVRSPTSPDLIAAIRTLPRDAVVAGFVDDLDFSPVLTGRSTLFSRELTIGYHLGYFRPVMARMADTRDAMLTGDPTILADRLRSNRVDLLLVPEEALVRPRIPDAFRSFFGSELEALEAAAARGGPTALMRLAGRCPAGRFAGVLALDAACLIREGALPPGS